MSDGSSVKITTVSGLLVTELTSNGGIATWDGLLIEATGAVGSVPRTHIQPE